MTVQTSQQEPIFLQDNTKRDVRTQFAALCYRMVKGKPEVLLVTSRRTKRWIIPKGWPMDGKTPGESALTEAWEEAGVRAQSLSKDPVGQYTYDKILKDGASQTVVTNVYRIEVQELADIYPEAEERTREWVSPVIAAERVQEPELRALLLQL